MLTKNNNPDNVNKILDKFNINLLGASISFLIGFICFTAAIVASYIIFEQLITGGQKIELFTKDNVHYILGGLFFSGILLIIIPLYFGFEKSKADTEMKVRIENEKKEQKFDELVNDIYTTLISNDQKIKEGWHIMKIGKYSDYKNLLKRENTNITIGIHKEGNLYVTMEDVKQANKFCESNKGWYLTSNHSSSIYHKDDENVLDRSPEDIVISILEYTEIVTK